MSNEIVEIAEVPRGTGAATASADGRLTLSLDGTWDVAESMEPMDRPTVYNRRAPVPGLTISAEPPFQDVGRFDSLERELIKKFFKMPYEEDVIRARGIARQQRNFFWYRTYFQAPDRYASGTLNINKAQFGSGVWLNGTPLGDDDSCFTSSTYDITDTVRWGERNELVIRIGAHPNVLPEGNVAPTDFEKARWVPGIWDSVSVWFCNGPSIVAQQIAPNIHTSEITVQTILRNVLPTAVTFELVHEVTGSKDATRLSGSRSSITLAGKEQRTITEQISVKGAQLWEPGSPVLYRLQSSTSGDQATTRFGMREFRFDTPTKRAYLNGKMIFLRGSSIVLQRFFEDPLCGTLAWDEQWVRKLLGTNPQMMNWNMLKFCISPTPKMWLDIADEVGLLVLYEFPMWLLTPRSMPEHNKKLDAKVLRREYERWLADSWNHPSIVYWNASEETELPPELSNDIIEDVRKLDLSGRAWGNAFNAPVGPDDPVEVHPYEFLHADFDMPLLELRPGVAREASGRPTGRALMNTEYGWFWLTRDGTPTVFAKKAWEAMPYPKATADERFETQAYLLAGLTEYWRAHRHLVGVLYWCYLAGSMDESWTSDNFVNIRALDLNPHFLNYVKDAFKPLGVYINFFQHQLLPGVSRSFDVMMINDEHEANAGQLSLRLVGEKGDILAEVSRPYLVAALGQSTYNLRLDLPDYEGHCRLLAQASPTSPDENGSTTSRRWVELTERPQIELRARNEVPEGQFTD